MCKKVAIESVHKKRLGEFSNTVSPYIVGMG
jgi:hypothetical protein